MKFALVIIISLIHRPLFANENILVSRCVKTGLSNSSTGSFFNWFGGLSRFSADSSDVNNAPCRVREETALNLKLIKDFLNTRSHFDKQIKRANINGVELSDESALMIGAFKNLTTAVLSLRVENPSNQKNMQASFNINPICQKVLCAVEKIWGPDLGPKLLYLLVRHSFNGSEFAYVESTRFEKEELDDVILALDDLPLFFIPLGRENQRLSHFTHNMTLAEYNNSGNPNTYANGMIMLFDSWSELRRPMRQYHVFHELSHNIALRLGYMDVSAPWRKLSEWTKDNGIVIEGESACFSSEYGATSPREDFAEAMSAYRYNGGWFKERCPQKYDFLKKNVFKDIEYLNDCTCSGLASNDEV